jgi:hypothetical protein
LRKAFYGKNRFKWAAEEFERISEVASDTRDAKKRFQPPYQLRVQGQHSKSSGVKESYRHTSEETPQTRGTCGLRDPEKKRKIRRI